MDTMKMIEFWAGTQGSDVCAGDAYRAFLDYAFSKTDFFMLVYINYFGHGYKKALKYFKKKLEPYKVKSRSNPSWPGTSRIDCGPKSTYNIVFYRTDPAAKEILKEVDAVCDWSWGYPEDLAFFKGSQCWFFSTGHEYLATIIHADEEDIDFCLSHGLAEKDTISDQKITSWYEDLDEKALDSLK